MYLLAKDKSNAALQQQADLLLCYRPSLHEVCGDVAADMNHYLFLVSKRLTVLYEV
jgi:hypothetical protein